jgi:hypothetical protein
MKNVAVFSHPFKKYAQVDKDKWEATHFLVWYRIYHDGQYVTTSIGKPRRHLGISPNSPHFMAIAEALADPCFDRFDSPHITISIISLHKPIHQRIQGYLLGQPDPKTSIDQSYQRMVKSCCQLIDKKRTVSMCADKGSSLRRVLPSGDVFDHAQTIVSNQTVGASTAREIEFCCNRAIDRHREHLLRLNDLFRDDESDTDPGNDTDLPF